MPLVFIYGFGADNRTWDNQSDDFADYHAIAGILQRRLSNAQKVVLPDVGHVSMMEAPEQFNETVAAFLVAH